MENDDNKTTKNVSLKQPKDKAQTNGKCPLFLGDTATGTKILQFLDGIPFSIFITIITLIALFSDDIRIIAFPPQNDQAFSIVTLICMGIYTIEMVALCFLRDGYFLRYYFWLDFISTVSMLLDLIWINALINGNGIQTASKVVKLAKVSRVSKIGAKSTKLIRIIRLIRVLRLYKTARNQLNKQNEKKLLVENQNQNTRQDDRKTSINAMIDANIRKTSKRLQKVRQASLAVAVRKNINSDTNQNFAQKQNDEKQQSKHEVSLKNIVFQGSQRKLSVLHPSKKLSAKVGSRHAIQSQQNPRYSSVQQIENMNQPDWINRNQKDFIENGKSVNIVDGSQPNNSMRNVQNQLSGNDIHLHSETRVGSRLKQQIQKNVVSMILLILISIPLLRGDTWFDNVNSYEYGVNQLTFLASYNISEFNGALPKYLEQMTALPEPLVYFSFPINDTCCEFPKNFTSYTQTSSLDSIRSNDINVYVSKIQVMSDKVITVAFDQSPTSKFQSQLSIGRTLFVCILLIVVTLLFTRDIEIQALQPLQNMIDTVKKISSNPLQAIKDIQKQNMIKHVIQSRGIKQGQTSEEELVLMAKQQMKNRTEPALLENMIIKIGSLLAVGFGQAGTQLIAKNIQSYGSLNVMMPGKKVMCIYGFCDIRNFTDATEVLQAGVMVFVNEIAEICHEVVNRVGGNPNKNIGDAFLLVWKFDEDDTITVQNRHQTDLQMRSSLKVKQTADLAVYSFVKMIAEIAKSHHLQKYKQNQGLKKRIKNYEGVKMGFGLHVGWSIEGPIGSQFKIDASYLGSHVNFSGRLQAATKQYGVPMLISQQLYQLMTLKNKEHLRQVDNVKLSTNQTQFQSNDNKIEQTSFGLYSVDLSVANLIKVVGVNSQKQISMFEKKKAKVFHNQQRDKLMSIIEKKRITAAIWNQDRDVKAMREPFTRFFYQEWKRGFQCYQKGFWEQAHDIMKKTMAMGINHLDGPSKALLDYMEQFNFIAPNDWQGARQFEG